MSRQLTPDLTIDILKKEAKRWLKALHSNDPRARARFDITIPGTQKTPTLRDVQLALAREFGLSGWTALKQKLTEPTPVPVKVEAPPDIVTLFLDNACPDHHVRGGSDHLRAQHTAMRLLEQHPDISRSDFYATVVCGDLESVNRALAADPGLATRANGERDSPRTGVGGEGDLYKKDWGAKGWEPLSYLCFTRLPLQSVVDNSVAIARTLLDHGANPNVYFMAGDSRYTPLVGVIGEGEEGRPAHSQRNALVRLLLDRGAEPYDIQVVYNIHFNGKVLWFLETIYEHSRQLGRHKDWADPEWKMLDMGGYGSGARWHLDIAVGHNDLQLAEWCLTHGADPNAAPGPQRRDRQWSLYDGAILRGHVELAELLVRYGAIRSSVALSPMEILISACVRSDTHVIREEVAKHPEYLRTSQPLFTATQHNRRDAAELLLDLGTSPDIESSEGEHALHIAAYYDSVDVAELLIERGAEIDPIGRKYENTPLGGAMHCQSMRMIDLLGRFSRSAWEVGHAGNVDRLRELLSERPERAQATGDGETLLMWLPPGDESTAMDVARLLLDNGADATVRDPQGMTAADRAERNAMFKVGALLREHE